MADSLANWVANHLFSRDEDYQVVSLEGPVVRVERKGMRSVEVACIKREPFTSSDLLEINKMYPTAEFVIIFPADSKILGDAYGEAIELHIGIGGMGDAMRALRGDDPGGYVHRETRYIERILSQHFRVDSFERLDNYRYRIERDGLSTVIAYIGSDYEITVDKVRSAVDKFSPFQAYVTANPNARGISPEATSAAASRGFQVYLWPEFMSALHREWN